MHIVSVESMVVELPFRQPFVVWRGEIPSKPHVFVSLTTDTGLTGWGEASPFLFYAPETAHDIDAFVRHAMRVELLRAGPARCPPPDGHVRHVRWPSHGESGY